MNGRSTKVPLIMLTILHSQVQGDLMTPDVRIQTLRRILGVITVNIQAQLA